MRNQEVQWATISYNEPHRAKMVQNEPQWPKISHNKPKQPTTKETTHN